MKKQTRYILRIFTLDRFYKGMQFVSWNNDFETFLKEENKHYGLKIISESFEVFIKIEYSNIIWEYKILFGSYRKKYKPLKIDDERFQIFEEEIKKDLKTIGLSHLKPELLNSLNKQEYFEYQEKTNMQFKKYCI